MKKISKTLFVGAFLSLSTLSAAKRTDAIATVVNGIEIPIAVVVPERGEGPFPVVYHVRGGGWNGGDEKTVPAPSLSPVPGLLSDELGVIYVGVAYRCKNQGGTFQLAIQDILDSIEWFEARAEVFNADIDRVGFSGGSAGAPLSALLAQRFDTCKAYIGNVGVYDFLDNDKSYFPEARAYLIYGLGTDELKREASALHNLRTQPPATLLFHGKKDNLTHHSQSVAFGTAVKAAGGEAEVVLFPELNHDFFQLKYPDGYKTAMLKIAHLLSDEFGLDYDNYAALEARLDRMVDGYRPVEVIDPSKLVGEWSSKNNRIRLQSDGTGLLRKNGKIQALTYQVDGEKILVQTDAGTETYFLQKDGRFIYTHFHGGHDDGKKHSFLKI